LDISASVAGVPNLHVRLRRRRHARDWRQISLVRNTIHEKLMSVFHVPGRINIDFRE
jgi:hypothetical protein